MTKAVKHYSFYLPKFLLAVIVVFAYLFTQQVNGQNFKKVTSTSNLTAGEKYILAGYKSSKYYILTNQTGNNRNAGYNKSDSSGYLLSLPIATSYGETNKVYELTLGGSTGNWTFYDPLNTGYLHAASSSNNYLRTQGSNNANGEWAITFPTSDDASIIAQGSFSRKYMQYNTSSDLIACYASASQSKVYVFRKAFKVTYNGNGNTGGTVPTDNDYYFSTETITAKTNSGSLVKSGYTFNGWNTAADGSGTHYDDGTGTFSISSDTELYAEWSAAGGTPPTLTAAGSATVDAAFDVTFTDDATWRAAITSVKIGGTTLTAGYSVSSGKITFTPSASSPASLLQTAGTKSISVQATGYADATVSQAIGAGAPNKLSVQTQPVGNATYNATTLATQPVIQVQDQYGNVTNAVSTITVNAAAVEGTWSLGGTNSINITAGNSSGSFTNLTATNTNGADITNAASISFTATGLTSATSNSFSIKILYQEPTENPTISGVVNSSSPTSAIDVSWSSVTANGYIVTRKVAAQPEAPTDGTSYTVGSAISSSTVVYVGTGTSFTDNSLSAGTQYRYRVYAYNGAGTGTYNYKTSPSPTADTTYTISNSPTAHAASFTATATSATNINLAFSAASTIPANGYLILRKASAFVAADYPTDGEAPNVGADVGPNGAKVNAIISSDGITTASYTANADETWYFLLVPFNWNGSNGVTRNYYTDPTIPTANATTSSKLSDVIAVASSSPATISSIINDAAPLTSSTGVQVWQITIRDGGASMNDADALPTKVNAITFTAGSGNAVAWNTAIKTAALFDGSTLVATASSITATQIEFTSLSIEVADNSSKTYSLRISLNESLGSGNDDGDDFQFQLSNTKITTANDGTSSAITNFSVIQTANNTENVIDVVATKLLFTLQPTNVAASPNKIDSVKVNATDVNGNLDAGFTATVNLQSTGSVLKNAPLSQSAVAGNVKFTNLEFFVPEEGIKLFATSTGLTTDTSSAFNVTRIFDTLSLWTFETSVPTNKGPHVAEYGGVNDTATAYHADDGTAFTNPVGNGSSESFSANTWTVGDYFQFTTSTSGYDSILLIFDQTGSSSGPKNFKLSYSTDGSSFTDISEGSYSLTGSPSWSSGTFYDVHRKIFDLSSITAINNQPIVYIRMIQEDDVSISGGTVAEAGTNRIDNVNIQGQPSTFTFTGAGDGSSWKDAANWSCNCGKVPTSNNKVMIPNGKNVILDTNYTARDLTLEATSTLKIAPSNTLTIEGLVNLNNQHVTIQSNATGTGSIGKITGILNDATNVTVERYISANSNRAYRMLTPTVNTSTSIKANWMEGVNNADVATNSNPNPGYGTHITGVGGASNGFDPTQNNQPSLFTLISGTWTAASNTTPLLDAKKGYLIFIRGSRDNINTINTTTGSSNTTLRATGTLLQGTQTFASLVADDFHFVTNPYAAAINWGSIYTNNAASFTKYVYVWDPNIGTRGGYVSIENDGTTSPSSTLTQYLQSGQAFFVNTLTGADKTLTITEDDKLTGNNSLDIYRSANAVEKLSVLLRFTANAKDVLADGVLARYANNYQNTLDDNDAVQMTNMDEDIAIVSNTKKLSLESRSTITEKDTMYLHIANLKASQANYRWIIAPQNFEAFRLQAYLVDNYTGTNTAINLSDTTTIQFTVSNIAASKANDRFKIVFAKRQAYYSKANNLSADDVNSWSSTKDGTGNAPSSFNEDALFVVQAAHTLNLSNTLNITNGYIQLENNAIINNTGNLNLSLNIDNNGTITGAGITTLNGIIKQIISGTGSISNLTLNNSAGATIAAESKLTILQNYQPSNGVLNTNNQLVLLSNETNTASIGTGNSAGNYLRGAVTIERYIPAKDSRKWSLITSPITQTIAKGWQQQIHITGAGTGGTVCPSLTPHTNGFDATLSNAPNMYSYNAAQQSGQRWLPLTNTLTETLQAGKGFRVNIRGDRNIGCNLLDGTITNALAVVLKSTGSINVENKNAGNFSINYANATANNYVLIGNPYPASISFSALQTANNSSMANNYAIYIPQNNAGIYTYWDGATQSFTGGLGYNNSAGNTIVSGQAFFVQAIPATDINLQFTEDQKINNQHTGYFKTQSFDERLKISYLQNNIKVDEAIIRFADDATIQNTTINSLDIPSMNSGTFISSLKANKNLVINTRNLPSLSTDEVWLNIAATNSGNYQLNFSDFENFAGVSIILKDHYTQTEQNIIHNANYHFTIDKDIAATKGSARFSVQFKKSLDAVYTSNEIKMYPNPANKQVTIEFPQNTNTNYQLQIADLAGKIVIQQKINTTTAQINLSKLTTGIYLVTITDNKGNKEVKKLVKE